LAAAGIRKEICGPRHRPRLCGSRSHVSADNMLGMSGYWNFGFVHRHLDEVPRRASCQRYGNSDAEPSQFLAVTKNDFSS
jgi:hypothetical protein